MLNYFLKQEIDFQIKDNKAVFKTQDPMMEVGINMVNDKFKDILGIELVVSKENKEQEEKKEESKI